MRALELIPAKTSLSYASAVISILLAGTYVSPRTLCAADIHVSYSKGNISSPRHHHGPSDAARKSYLYRCA